LTKTVRLILLSSVCAVALAFGTNALAAYNPSLLTAGTSHGLGNAGPVVVGVGQDQNDDATGEITFYSPRGYAVTLTQAPGTRIGDIDAVFRVGTTPVQIQGTVTARDPAAYTNQLQFPCGNGVRHEAVWLIESTLNNTRLEIPMFVDRTVGAEAQFSSAKIKVCFASPYIPPPQGAPSGASLMVAAFSVQGVFRNPSRSGSYPWNAIFTPFSPGTGTLNPANAAQSTSYTRLPVALTVRATKVKRGQRTFARVTACLTEAGRGVRGIRINILSGRTARPLGRVGGPRTNSRGCATQLVRVRYRVTFIRAGTTLPDRDVTNSPGCTPVIPVAGINPRCTSATLSPVIATFFSRTTVRVRR
jgi:hypothetical protein